MLLVQSTIRIRTKAQDVKCQCKISNVEWEMCNVKYQVSSVECQVTIDKSQITKGKKTTINSQMINVKSQCKCQSYRSCEILKDLVRFKRSCEILKDLERSQKISKDLRISCEISITLNYNQSV